MEEMEPRGQMTSLEWPPGNRTTLSWGKSKRGRIQLEHIIQENVVSWKVISEIYINTLLVCLAVNLFVTNIFQKN